LTEEGAIQLLSPLTYEGEPIYAAVGSLQFDVMRFRLQDEYSVETLFTPLPYQCSAWIIGNVETFKKPTNAALVKDMHGKPMVLFHSPWEKSYAAKQNPDHELIDLN